MGNITCKDLCLDISNNSLCNYIYKVNNDCLENLQLNLFSEKNFDNSSFQNEFNEKKKNNLMKINDSYIVRNQIIS